MGVTVIRIVIGIVGMDPKRYAKKTGRIRSKNRDHLDHSIVKTDQNTQKSPGYL